MYDLIVIGGGINGCGIARDAAGRGLKTLLVEKGDLANATSSVSTKLIHGGLRYLEQYDFKLVAESLTERERLLRAAPHIIWPQEFILPYEPHLRPYFLIRAGLFLYDFLGKREILPSSKGINLKKHPAGQPLKADLERGFSYADCRTQDSRLVVLNAIDAKEKGADIQTRTECISLKCSDHIWHATLKNTLKGDEKTVQAKMVVNAAGPWVRKFLEDNGLTTSVTYKTRYSKGSHIILPRLYEGEHAYILQQPDKRIVFAIPYEKYFTLIGTTDSSYEGDPKQAQISEEEKQYLCDAINRSFERQVSPDDIVWDYSGVRALLDSGNDNLSKVTRDYKLDLETSFGAPILNVFGGKLTTFRKLADQALDLMSDIFSSMPPSWTEHALLPGGDIKDADFDAFLAILAAEYSWMSPDVLYRYARSYGTRSSQILNNAKRESDLGEHYGDGIYEAEIAYLVSEEFAMTAEDILWRRSKLGLHISLETKETLQKELPDLIKELDNVKRTIHSVP